MTRVAARDREAFSHLYDLTSRLVYSLALRIVRHREDAEDVTAEVYAQAWRNAAQYDASRGSVESWLITMTRARAIDHLRARRARPDADAARVVSVEVAADSVSAGDQLERCEIRRRTARMLDVLGDDERQLVMLAFFEGFTHTELAERLRWPLGTVKTRIRASLRKIRRALEQPRVDPITAGRSRQATASPAGRARVSRRASARSPLVHTAVEEVPA